jgi:hypothetical protein
LNALAYTSGHDIAFAPGQYAPDSNGGRRLLAHELTHVVQQGGGAGIIQRRCGPRAIGAAAPPGCSLVSRPAAGERFLFTVNCDDFAAGEEARLAAFARTIPTRANIRVLGLASLEGPPGFNEALSCHRADKGEAVLLREGVSPAQISAVEASGGVPPANDPSRRAVVIDLELPLPKCGPEVNDWYARQVTAATTDPAVLAIRADLAAADVIARRHGTSARQVAEGSTAAAVAAQLGRMSAAGTPAPTPTPTAAVQIAAGTAAGAAAASSLSRHPIDGATIAFHIGRAATAWAALVNHGARYDFKAHTMRSPTTRSCPDPACRDTVTICHGAGPENCYVTDLPGNFFYAQIGRFVGWSELTLQLGSQLAQLTGTGTWDVPQDTAAIHFGYSLPIPMTSAALCAGLPAVRGSLNSRSGCGDCRELTTAAIR